MLCFSFLGAEVLALDIGGKAYFLMDPYSGRVFLEESSETALPVASISKVMTLVLVLEAVERGEIGLGDLVTASPFAASKRGSRIWLEAGEQLTLDELIHAIAVGSANDAAVAVAEFMTGSEANFVELMESRGRELGLSAASFKNSTGLPEDDGSNVMSAQDVAILVQHALGVPLLMDYVSTYEHTMRADTTKIPVLWNGNRLLRRYYGVDGMKTGFTTEAGYCIAATADRDDFRLIAVTLGHKNEEERESAARALLDYGFRKYQSLKLYSQEDVVGALESPTGTPRLVDVVLPADFFVTVERGKELDLTTVISLEAERQLPIREGDTIGTIIAYYGEEVVGTSLLTVSQTVQKLSLPALVWRLGQAIAQSIF
ncbi:MAG TPA: D-alanyl-D-alanine carboxypeptidase family protein [Limnochordia bacterium]|nr:D-alanyl-D-alanine carboxypeptidase family protein [Limnochordia bacterium]